LAKRGQPSVFRPTIGFTANERPASYISGFTAVGDQNSGQNGLKPIATAQSVYITTVAALSGSRNDLRQRRERRSGIMAVNHSDFRRSIRSEKRTRRKRTSIVENRRYPIYSGICICNGLQSFYPVDTAFSTTPTYYQGGSRQYPGIKASFKALKHPTHHHNHSRGYGGLRHHSGCSGNMA